MSIIDGRQPGSVTSTSPPCDEAATHRGSGQRHGGALAGDGLGHLFAVYLQGPDARVAAAGQNANDLAARQPPRPERSGHHCSGPLHREDPVDRKPEEVLRRAHPRPRPAPHEGLGERGQAGRIPNGGGNHLGVAVGRVFQEILHILAHQFQPLVVDQIGLGDGDHHRPHAQQPHDSHVFARLGHHALVGSDHQKNEVHTRRPRDHRPHEALVPGDIHDPEGAVLRGRVGRKAEFDRDAAPSSPRPAGRCRPRSGPPPGTVFP